VTELPPDIEQRIADMSVQDFDLLVYRTRPPEEPNPMDRAAEALRKSRGLDRDTKATREQATEAMRRYRTGYTN
jgi:hypothetical protein